MRSARTFGFCIFLLNAWVATAQAPIPTIEQPLVPAAAQPGGAGFTLTINGAGFVPTPTAVIWREGTNLPIQLPITSSTATQLVATIPAANIAGAGTSFVSVLNANGNPSNVEFFQIALPASPLFGPPVDYSPSLDPVQTVLVGDFNADGVLDLAVGVLDDPSAVCVLLGNSNGTFQAPTCYPVNDATSIVAGRFRNDGGAIDLVAGDTLLRGNGDGTFSSIALPTSGFRPYAVGDFSQTGSLDVAGFLNGGPAPLIQILNNNGAGGFTVGQSFTGGVSQASGMLTADFNGDGIPDLAVLDTGSSSIRVFLGSAAGFSGGNPVVTNTPAAVVAFTAADFNADKKQDIAIVYNTTGGQVLILTGNGDGTFTNGSTTPLANIVSASIVTGDFNEDGKLDLATGTFILPGNSDGTFQTPINFGGANQILATGDFNGDGRPDLVGQASPNIAVLLQTATAPGAMLSPTPLNFTPKQPQLVGTSASQPVTLTNNGTAPLTISSISITGTNANEFTQTNNCPSALVAGANCTINVSFAPTANNGGGSASASLSVTDNAASSPQTVPISGNVQNFSLTTTCTSLTVVPGQTAIFTVDLAPVNGFTQSVSLSCSGAPALANCTVSPTSPALNGTSSVQAQVTATTSRATGYLHLPLGRSNGYQLAALSGIAGFATLVMLPGKRRLKSARRMRAQIFLWCILAAIATLPSCSGGSASDPPGTATGTYPLTVTGTFQSPGGATVTESVSFNLVVQ